MVLVAVVIAALPAGAQPASDARQVRLIVTAFRQELAQAESYATFQQAITDHFDTHVAPLLAEDKPNLVVYPERMDRLAMLIGLRGQAARDQLADGANLGTARLALYGPYAAQIGYYRTQFDGLADTQYLQLALTDTVARAVTEGFAGLAQANGVHIVVGAALPDHREAPAGEAMVLRDVEAGDVPGYVATAPEVTARTLVLSPDGEVVADRPKVYLEGVELSRSETGEGLTSGEFGDIETVELPFARLGVAAGWDAQMPDVGARLEQLGANVMLQPLSHGRWAALLRSPSMWPPDQFRRGTWLQVQRHPGLRAAATSVLTGRLGADVFDGQPAVAGLTGPGATPGRCLVGTAPDGGWLAVGPWSGLVADDVDLCDPASRAAITELADAQIYAQGAGLASFHDGALATDVALADTPDGTGVEFAELTPPDTIDTEGGQLSPALSVDAESTWLLWVRHDEGLRRVAAATRAPGDAWSDPTVVFPLTRRGLGHTNDQGPPAVAHMPDRDAEVAPGLSVELTVDAHVAFPVLEDADWEVYSGRHDSGEDEWGSFRRADRAPSESFFGDPEDRLKAHWEVALTPSPTGAMTAVWSDLRWPYAHPQARVAVAPTSDSWTHHGRVVGTLADPDRETATQPSAAEPGEVRPQIAPTAVHSASGVLVVAWQETSLAGRPRIHVARSFDDGSSFQAPVDVDGTGTGSWRPALAVAGDRIWLAWESAAPDGGRQIVVRRSDDAGATWTPPDVVDATRPPDVTQRSAAITADATGAVVAYLDDRAGEAALLATPVDPSGAGTTVRIDGAEDGTAVRDAAIALREDGRLVVAWQEGTGTQDSVRVAEATLRRGATAPGGTSEAAGQLPATGGGSILAALVLLAAAMTTMRTRGSRTTSQPARAAESPARDHPTSAPRRQGRPDDLSGGTSR